ncbi:hypothetical protein [Salisediminibacterium selenitireducens]|uniref:Uncharacterized protein n=1 Tax=Bacillus selenitireducens (strain ATCC 700615 / DSM 15326 / MLS10) TaxID=439292 RepID=D6XZW5_BACIE|nr:hypothetical protein [Salisediminibacterium selenitireducens]ADI00467.1 hypothetical protein Bsel_2984 [[Bacillus] selenitireducens MLS10]
MKKYYLMSILMLALVFSISINPKGISANYVNDSTTTILWDDLNNIPDTVTKHIHYNQDYSINPDNSVTINRSSSIFGVDDMNHASAFSGFGAAIEYTRFGSVVNTTDPMSSFYEPWAYFDVKDSREDTQSRSFNTPISADLSHSIILNSLYSDSNVNWKKTISY